MNNISTKKTMILLGLILVISMFFPKEIIWAGNPNQTVPTIAPSATQEILPTNTAVEPTEGPEPTRLPNNPTQTFTSTPEAVLPAATIVIPTETPIAETAIHSPTVIFTHTESVQSTETQVAPTPVEIEPSQTLSAIQPMEEKEPGVETQDKVTVNQFQFGFVIMLVVILILISIFIFVYLRRK